MTLIEIFTKSDCGPCKIALAKLQQDLQLLVTERSLDDPEELAKAKALGIRAVPTMRVFDDYNNEIARYTGTDLFKWIEGATNE